MSLIREVLGLPQPVWAIYGVRNQGWITLTGGSTKDPHLAWTFKKKREAERMAKAYYYSYSGHFEVMDIHHLL
jgi:hypothetical protein